MEEEHGLGPVLVVSRVLLLVKLSCCYSDALHGHDYSDKVGNG